MIKRNFQTLYQEDIDPWYTKDAQGFIYDEVLKRIKKYQPSFRNVLDLGCGNDAFTHRLSDLSNNITAIDMSLDAINYAKQRYSNINFLCGDISHLESLPLSKGKFDLVTVLDVLYYFPSSKIRKILDNIWNLVSEDGIVVLRHYAPGGGYLTHSEWLKLVSEKFNIRESDYLKTQHSLIVCQKKFVCSVFTLDYETWQPLPEGKKINWENDIFIPTEKLLDLAEKYQVKLSFFVELGEYYWCQKNLPQIALKMAKQWQEIIKRGHDVQIHLHPSWLPECGARHDAKTNVWFWDEKYQRIYEAPLDKEEILKRCKTDLERILKPLNPDYQAIVFRAGKYQIQPNKEIFEIFSKLGILADSSVWKGGYSKEYQFDFREAYSNYQPYFASKYNINYLAPWGEAEILEIPILSNGQEKWTLDNSNFRKWKKFISPFLSQRKYSFLRFDLSLYPPNPFHNQILNKIYHLYLKVLNKIERFINRKTLILPSEEIVLTAIGHTKQNIDLKELEKLFKYLSQNHTINFKTISEIVKEYQKQKKLIQSENYYHRHLQSQEAYDKKAILGDKRNWQQSFYAQDKIPLDRKNILDLGCGAGYWTKRLNDIIGKTIGIDMSEDFLNKAREKYPEIEFKKMDFHHLEFPDNSFDCVYADNVLEHSPYPQRVLAEIYRVLTDKGLLVALIPPDARNPQFSGLDHVWKTDKDEIEMRLKEIGFSNIKIEDINIAKKFKMSSYRASKNSLLITTAWKWKNGYNALERCKDIMNFVYYSLSPEKSQTSNEPLKILKGGFAWCGGYATVMKYLCEKEGFKVRHYTLYSKDHPHGRGKNKIDTHDIVEILIEDKWFFFDPTVNKYLAHSFKEILNHPELLDKDLQETKQDERWYQRQYYLYFSSQFYKKVIKYQIN